MTYYPRRYPHDGDDQLGYSYIMSDVIRGPVGLSGYSGAAPRGISGFSGQAGSGYSGYSGISGYVI